MNNGEPFWETTPLRDMTQRQWESLCDGCARCCLHKLEDAHTGKIYYTSVACRLLQAHTCRCSDYTHRQQQVPDCMVLSPARSGELGWLPDTCAYRRLDEGKGLPHWHPLLTGDPESMHRAGISVRGKIVSERDVHEDDYENFVVDWIATCRNPHRHGDEDSPA